MGDPQQRTLPKHQGSQLRSAVHQAGGLAELVFSVVASDFEIGQTFFVGKFTHLEGIPCGDQQGIAPGLQLLHDRLEKWDVRSVVEINPDFWFALHAMSGGNGGSPPGVLMAASGFPCLDETGHFMGEGVPELPWVGGIDILQQFLIMFDRKLKLAVRASLHRHVIGMGIEQDHPAVGGDPVEFPFPDIDGFFLQDEEQRGILTQRVRQLHITFRDRGTPLGIRPVDPKRKDGMPAFRLGLERVGIERRGIVLDLQLVEPIEVLQHETGPESVGIPLLQMLIDAHRLPFKSGEGGKKMPIVPEIVNSDFKPIGGEFPPQFRGHPVRSFGNKIEGTPETERLLSPHQFRAFPQAGRSFDIVGQHQTEFFTVRPPGPSFRRPF